MNQNPSNRRLPWEELELRAHGAAHLSGSDFATRVLAETSRLRAEAVSARENARVMVTAAFALSVLLLGYVEFNGWQASTAASTRLEEWHGMAQWVETLE